MAGQASQGDLLNLSMGLELLSQTASAGIGPYPSPLCKIWEAEKCRQKRVSVECTVENCEWG